MKDCLMECKETNQRKSVRKMLKALMGEMVQFIYNQICCLWFEFAEVIRDMMT